MVDNSTRTEARSESARARQQSNETARVADRVAQTADSAASTGAHLANETARAAEEMSERANELTRQGVETIQKGVESSLDIGSRLAERSMSLFVGAAGIPTDETKEAADRALQNVLAMVDSGSILMTAFQEAGQNWLDRSRERARRDMDLIEAMFRSRTLTELTDAQTTLARRQLEALITEGQRATELFSRAAVTALKKIKTKQDPSRAA
jgi:hypothetical protein